MWLPVWVGSTAGDGGWQIAGQRGAEAVRTAVADAAGVATVSFATVAPDELWCIDRVVVSTSTGAATWFKMYLDRVENRQLIDGTPAGDFDVNDTDSPIEIPGGLQLVCQWTGGVPGAECICRLHYSRLIPGGPDGV